MARLDATHSRLQAAEERLRKHQHDSNGVRESTVLSEHPHGEEIARQMLLLLDANAAGDSLAECVAAERVHALLDCTSQHHAGRRDMLATARGVGYVKIAPDPEWEEEMRQCIEVSAMRGLSHEILTDGP
ncbi:hypothetical protein [Rarobacter incanus]|uniref:Uncharacterized protein n=1 Tax=Rarobacter incanus TaxID=153494 RepID=A0A542SM44_9MICO|nr:hypothetical protein [Rarobacter incanus]TQK75699.1 hypothetical protein FB389_0332 [Rarobacter incanus]